MTGESQTAEDLVQEACLRAYRGFDGFEQGTNYQAWIFRILRNLCTDHMRRRGRAPFVDWNDEEVARTPASHGSQIDRPDVHFLHKSFRNDAFRAMERLTPEVRTVVSLALVDGLSYLEIAEIAGCPVGTVRSRLSRGRQQLQADLIEYMPDDGERPSSPNCRPVGVKPRG